MQNSLKIPCHKTGENPLTDWLHHNLTNSKPILDLNLPCNMVLAFGICKLSRNEQIYEPPIGSLNQLLLKSIHLAI